MLHGATAEVFHTGYFLRSLELPQTKEIRNAQGLQPRYQKEMIRPYEENQLAFGNFNIIALLGFGRTKNTSQHLPMQHINSGTVSAKTK